MCLFLYLQVWRVSDGKLVKMLPPYKHCARVCAVNTNVLCVGYDDGSLQVSNEAIQVLLTVWRAARVVVY